ncbi:SDR family oxidoreductase [bacterium]|nr:SDR family oxidoreductase [bacterium]
MDFNGKIAFITGGSSGIGLAIARQLFTQGANVFIFSRNDARLVNAVKEIRRFNQHKTGRIDSRVLDVSQHELVTRVMDEAVETFGVPDILINCAGRSYPHYFEEISYQQFDETIKINLYGIWNVTAALFPRMKAKGGHIINVSSLAGFIGVFGFTDYSASKFGIIGFSESLRSEGKRYGIKVSVLCPADTDTPSFEIENRTKPPETMAVSETADLFQPEEIAEALCKKIGSNSFLIIPGLMPKVTYYLKRLFPGIVEMIMDRVIRKVQNN